MEPFNYGDNFDIHSNPSSDTRYRFWKEVEKLALEKTREQVRERRLKNGGTW